MQIPANAKRKEVGYVPTLEDIAHALGVSKGTVSKALNMAEDVSPAMRHAVVEKAVEMGYTRNARGKNRPKLAIFVCNMEYVNPADFGYDIIMGFRKAAEPDGYCVEIVPMDLETQNAMEYDSYMLQHNYSGGFFLGFNLCDPWLRQCRECTTATVLLDNQVQGNPRVTQVGVDNAAGMRMAVSYLKSLGHTRIGYLGSDRGSYIYRLRYEAFCHALRKFDMPIDPEILGTEGKVMDCVYHLLPRLLDHGCTAIVCSHDILASSALTYCAELGKSVPRDVSILGFDDIPLCQYTSPALSTIRQDRSQIGKSAYYALFNQFKGIPLASLLLHPKLICRNSCAQVHL